MVNDRQVSQTLPCEDVETVAAVILELNKNHDEPADRRRFWLPDDLPLSVEGDFAELSNTGELPGTAATSFDLHGNMFPILVGRDDVVVWHIPGERGGDESLTRQFGGDQILPGLTNNLVTPS